MLYRALSVFCFIVFLAGCNGAEPLGPNVYQAPGCPMFTMVDCFEHVGTPELDFQAECTGNNCSILRRRIGAKTKYDLFLNAASDKVQKEICLYVRHELTSRRTEWELPRGNRITLNGDYYSELFGFYKYGEEGLLSPVEDYLASKGYAESGPGFLLYIVQRNVSMRTRFAVVYGYNYCHIPVEVREDNKKLEQFMRDTFANRIMSM